MAKSTYVENALKEINKLERAKAALEGYRDLIKQAGPSGISKQAAAIMHTGIKHIDITCGLRVRSTGMEDFDARPRSAMESVEVDDKSLGNRIREIGAKILTWIKKIFEAVKHKASNLMNGITTIENNAEKLEEAIKSIKNSEGLPETAPCNYVSMMWLGDKFIGNQVTKDEMSAAVEIKRGLTLAHENVTKPIGRQLRKGIDDDTIKQLRYLVEGDEWSKKKFQLGGGVTIEKDGYRFSIVHDENESSRDAKENTIPVDDLSALRREWRNVRQFIEILASGEGFGILEEIEKDLVSALTEARQKEGHTEDQFQEAQKLVTEFVKRLNPDDYIAVHRMLAQVAVSKLKAYRAYVTAYGTNDDASSDEPSKKPKERKWKDGDKPSDHGWGNIS